MTVKSHDPESCVSTNFTTRAKGLLFGHLKFQSACIPFSDDLPRQRFELRLDEPKSPVLPLHHQGVQKNGDDEIRTHDPHNAIVVLFQLSYVPVKNYSPNRAIIGAVVNAFFSFFATVRIFSKDCLFFSVFSCFAAGCGRGGAQC